MFLTLKALHFLALAIGLGGGVANIVIGAKAGADAPQVARPIQKFISRLAFAALIMLWITGLWMIALNHSFATLGLWFWIKILVVLLLSAAAITAQISLLRPGPTTPARLKTLGLFITACATLAVILAVISFG